MKRISVIINIAALFFLSATMCFCQDTVIKIGLLNKISSFILKCDGVFYVYDFSAGQKSVIQPDNNYNVKSNGSKIYIGENIFQSPIRLLCDKSKNYLSINGRRYRESIIINANEGKMNVINELDIESYIYGILPREVSPEWPLETLKAQAVASRTYALRNKGKHAKEGFDLCSETHCQVFGGMESEDSRSNKAVDETAGQILMYNGVLTNTLFHASCGGHTENPNNVWSLNSKSPEYLEGCRDKFCKNSPHQNWVSKISQNTIRADLKRAGYNIGYIKKMKLCGVSGSGRTKNIIISHSKGVLNIPASKFRMIISPWLIKSTYFVKIKKIGKSFEFIGKGWGHGVGLCQWGAKGMGEKGYNYKEILKFFYPETEIMTVQ